MILQDYYVQQCFVIPNFFSSWICCFDRPSSPLIRSSSTGLQDIVDKARETEKETRLSHHDDLGEHQYDRELSSSFLLWYLVADTVDRVDPGYIKGGSLIFA